MRRMLMPQYCELLRRLRDGGCDAALAALYTDASAQVMPAVMTACLALPVRERAPAHGWLRDCGTSPAARFG